MGEPVGDGEGLFVHLTRLSVCGGPRGSSGAGPGQRNMGTRGSLLLLLGAWGRGPELWLHLHFLNCF